jgi:hypothetical protein
MSDTDQMFDDDPEEIKKFAEAFEQRRQILYERICDFIDEEQIDEGYASHLLFDAAINARMTAYGMGVESPSVAGLKIDLDRVAREVGEMLREAKKGAEEFIREIKEERARLEAEADAARADEKDE